MLINDILFKSRRSIEWDEIEKLLRKFIGNYYEIAETAEKIYIGSDFQMNLHIQNIQRQ